MPAARSEHSAPIASGPRNGFNQRNTMKPQPSSEPGKEPPSPTFQTFHFGLSTIKLEEGFFDESRKGKFQTFYFELGSIKL